MQSKVNAYKVSGCLQLSCSTRSVWGAVLAPASTLTDHIPSLQVVRAKERIEMEIDEKVCPDPTPGDSPEDSDSSSKPS